MLSNLNLLASPYCADHALLAKPYQAAIDELRNTQGPGWAALNRPASVMALKNAFGVVDGRSAIAQCEELAVAAGSWADPLIAAQQVPALAMLAGAAGARGFDDCRIVNLLTRARTAGYIDDAALAELLESHARRALAHYSGWGQYLASVIVGKTAFQAMYATSGSPYIVDEHKILEATHIMALSAHLTLFPAGLWPPEDLSALISAIETLIPAESSRAARLGVGGWVATAGHPLDAATTTVLQSTATDAGTFLRSRALAQEVFWLPVDMARLWPVFEDLRSSRLPPWDLPAHGDGRAAKTFWRDVRLERKHWSGVPFLRISDGGRLTAVLTEQACILVAKAGVHRTFTPVPWEQMRITATVSPGKDVAFHAHTDPRAHAHGALLGTLYPDWGALGPASTELAWRLEALLNGLGARVRSFSAAHPL
ncbi:DUF1266 domain-containing protein [Actinomyces bowdenii]|uniref:DUF1266 domain-containing protein n=1 Tax=Actinomyces bowdenii TaxID=131109 RepID=A0A853EMS2_9ACTO|nr:DUF1266 domain-containing protein [Actinomyces bowdenii]MBF0697399.1 DUF1266 domain-containing protein [Actinomyces bowdenii]NYS69572.1 DUF1266 domain-containing protein [Actinomyces bowdenii]